MSWGVLPLWNRFGSNFDSGSRMVDTGKYSVTYDEYATSKMNSGQFKTKTVTKFIDEDGNITEDVVIEDRHSARNEFFDDNKNLRFNVHGTQYTLDEKINFMLDNNIFNLDMNLVFWSEKGKDRPMNFSRDIYYAFFSYFWHRQINQQTVDLHGVKLRAFFGARKLQLTAKFRAYNQFTLNTTQTTDHNNNAAVQTSTLYRGANSTVPENKVDVDVASTSLDYADNFQKNKKDTVETHTGGNQTINSTNHDKDLGSFLNVESELQKLFDEAVQQQLFMFT
jgi:hypothetical protein